MSIVRIYAPAKSAMQSGVFKNLKWRAEFDAENAVTFTDPLMGWQGGNDTRKQLRLFFDTEEAAIAYAKKRGVAYRVVHPQSPRKRPKSYAENFTG